MRQEGAQRGALGLKPAFSLQILPRCWCNKAIADERPLLKREGWNLEHFGRKE